jgi:hypothetical protein
LAIIGVILVGTIIGIVFYMPQIPAKEKEEGEKIVVEPPPIIEKNAKILLRTKGELSFCIPGKISDPNYHFEVEDLVMELLPKDYFSGVPKELEKGYVCEILYPSDEPKFYSHSISINPKSLYSRYNLTIEGNENCTLTHVHIGGEEQNIFNNTAIVDLPSVGTGDLVIAYTEKR